MKVFEAFLSQLEDGRLLLEQRTFSATVHRLILQLPRREWTGKGWAIPHSDEALVLHTLVGVNVVRNGAVVRRPVHRAQTAPLPTLIRADAPRAPAPTARRASSMPMADLSWYPFKAPPMDHQRTAIARALRYNTFAFLMDMGTGKTRTVTEVLSALKLKDQIDGALIVSPLNAVYNWEREIGQWSPLDPAARVVSVIAGDADAKLAAMDKPASFYVTNFATLLKYEAELTALVKGQRMAMVVDESTNIKNHSTRTWKAAYRIRQSADFAYILTGSPITQDALDAFAQFKFLDWKIIGHQTFASFRNEFGILGGFKGKEVVAFKNLDRLRDSIAPHSIRVLKKDCLDLPDKVYRTLDLKMGPKQAQLYKAMRDDAVVEFGKAKVIAPLVVTKLLRLQQITAGFLPVIDDKGETIDVVPIPDATKTAAVIELVEEAVASSQKVIIWGRFHAEIDKLKRDLDALKGVTAVPYTGRLSGAEKQETVDAFQRDPKVNVFIGQIQTGATAITLTAASLVIYHSNSFSLSDRLQSEDRAHRIGQTNKVTYVDPVLKGTVDKVILRAHREKKDIADLVTGDNLVALEEEA